MSNARILFFTHDLPRPAGGVRAIYAHVRHLVRHGYPACVVHTDPRFRPFGFEESVPTLYHGDGGLKLYPNDILIIPEDYHTLLDAFKSAPIRKIVYCQNHFYIPDGLGQHRSWRELGIERVFASSEVVAGFLQSVLGWNEVPVVHYAIDLELFKPRPKQFQIAYMPRKLPQHSNFLRNIWNQLPDSETNLRWVPIDGMSESATAAILGESTFFLSTSYLEGFGLPPVEAMACRCLVVGYHGYGGLEYATPENGYWCEEANPVACLQTLRRVVALARSGSLEVEKVLDCASKTASRYTAERQEREMLQFVKAVLGVD